MEDDPNDVLQINDDSTFCDGSDCGDGSSGLPMNPLRWNPTQEQMNLLESLYNQGIKTPCAAQIKQIATSLRAFGHIEAKNVFYWFQNHKARQRQKQKEETMAYYKRFKRRSPNPTVPSNTHPDSPNDTGFDLVVAPPAHESTGVVHQPCNKVPLTSSERVSSPSSEENDDKNVRIMSRGGAASEFEPVSTLPLSFSYIGCGDTQSNVGGWGTVIGSSNMPTETFYKKTLALFPVSPTGLLQEKEDNNLRLCLSEIDQVDCSSGHDRPFFNFLSI